MQPTVILKSSTNAVDSWLQTDYFLEFANGFSNHSGIQCISFSGCGVIASHFSTSVSDVPIFRSKEELWNAIAESTGSFTATFVNFDTRETYMVNDPLGGGPIFRYKKGDFCAIGSDLEGLLLAIEKHGFTTSVDPLFEFANLATGTPSYAADTPYKGVDLIDLGLGVIVGADGQLQFLEYFDRKALVAPNDQPSEDLVNHGITAIRNNMQAVANSKVTLKLADITGGFDSRLVLAAILDSSLQSDIVLTSIRTNPEWDFAERLSVYSGLPLTNHRIRTKSLVSFADVKEQAFAPVRRSMGIISNQVGHYSIPQDTMALQGGYGGTFRTVSNSYMPRQEDVAPDNFYPEIWAWTKLLRAKVAGTHLFSTAGIDALVQRSSRYNELATRLGVPPEHFSSFLYLFGRNRYWFGMQSFYTSMTHKRFNPLYNLPLINAAFNLSFAERRSNLIGLRAMSKLNPELLSLPFYGKPRVTKLYEERYGKVPQRKFPEGPYKHLAISPVAVKGKKRRIQEFILDPPATTSELAYEAICASELAAFFNRDALAQALLHPSSETDRAWKTKLITTAFRAGLLN